MNKPYKISKIIRVITTIVVIVSIAYLIGYYASANSEAFDKARAFVMQSHIANDVLGDVTAVKLTPLGYQLEFAGDSGSASFRVEVNGTKSRGEAVIRLTKTFGAWGVTSATLQANDQEISLL